MTEKYQVLHERYERGRWRCRLFRTFFRSTLLFLLSPLFHEASAKAFNSFQRSYNAVYARIQQLQRATTRVAWYAQTYTCKRFHPQTNELESSLSPTLSSAPRSFGFPFTAGWRSIQGQTFVRCNINQIGAELLPVFYPSRNQSLSSSSEREIRKIRVGLESLVWPRCTIGPRDYVSSSNRRDESVVNFAIFLNVETLNELTIGR